MLTIISKTRDGNKTFQWRPLAVRGRAMLAPTSKILKPATFYKKIGASDAKLAPTWWGMVDSNHRRHCQQIYSLSPLATREIPHIHNIKLNTRWSWWTDSNPRPADYKSAALPTELHQHDTGLHIIANHVRFVNKKISKSVNIFHIRRDEK